MPSSDPAAPRVGLAQSIIELGFLRHAGVPEERSAIGQLSNDQLEDLYGYKEDKRQYNLVMAAMEADRLAVHDDDDAYLLKLQSGDVRLNNPDLNCMDFDAVYRGSMRPSLMRALLV